MVEEQLAHEGQIFTVDGVLVAIYLEHRHIELLIAINFIAWRVEEGTFLSVSQEFLLKGEEVETEVADVEAIEVVVVDGVGTEVPRLGGVGAQLDAEDGLELGDFLMGEEFGVVHAVVGVVVGVHVAGVVFRGCLFDLEVGLADAGIGHPVVVALVEVLEVHVVGIAILILGSGGIII